MRLKKYYAEYVRAASCSTELPIISLGFKATREQIYIIYKQGFK